EKVFDCEVVATERLEEILHRGHELAIRAADLFEQHVAEFRIRRVNAHRMQELFYVVVHPATPRRDTTVRSRLRAQHIAYRSQTSNRRGFVGTRVTETRV